MSKKIFRFAFIVWLSLIHSAVSEPSILGGLGSIGGGGCGPSNPFEFSLSTSALSSYATVYPTTEGKKYAVLYYVKETDRVCLDSNVSAEIYVNGKKVGKTPFCGDIARGLTTDVVLKAKGYSETKVSFVKKLNSKLTKEPVTTSSKQTAVNVSFTSKPSSSDATYTSQGRWIEYSPHSYYVEMVPLNKKPDKQTENVAEINRKIKDFALKSFYEIKAGNNEYVEAMTALTDLPREDIRAIVKCHVMPERFSKEITLRENKIRNFAYRNFREIKAKKVRFVDALSALSGLTVKEILTTIQKYPTPETFPAQILYLVYSKERSLSKRSSILLHPRTSFPDWFQNFTYPENKEKTDIFIRYWESDDADQFAKEISSLYPENERDEIFKQAKEYLQDSHYKEERKQLAETLKFEGVSLETIMEIPGADRNNLKELLGYECMMENIWSAYIRSTYFKTY